MPGELSTPQVLGVDVSAWQPKVDWAAVADAGYRFAICKATEGTKYAYKTFAEQWKGAKDAGLMVGAYHFALWENDSAKAEADYFVAHIEKTIGKLQMEDISPVLDLEWRSPPDPNLLARCRARTPDQIVEWAITFLERVEVLTERWPIIYTGPSFYKQRLSKAKRATGLTSWRYWVADYQSEPGKPKYAPWDAWTIHQYTGKGKVPGVPGACDINVFNGAEADLNLLAGGRRA